MSDGHPVPDGAHAHLVLLPGMGADERMFAAQRARFPHLVTPAWIDPEPGESLEAYARRLAASLPRLRGPVLLGGVSFGGMVAHEVARVLKPDGVVLIGSATSAHDVPAPLRALSRTLAWRLPRAVFERTKPLSPLAVGRFGVRGHPEHRALFLRMLREAPPDFIHWAAGAVGRWRPDPLLEVPVLRIHGSHDRVLPPSPEDELHLVEGAGHLLNMTHAEEVNAFLAAAMERLAEDQDPRRR